MAITWLNVLNALRWVHLGCSASVLAITGRDIDENSASSQFGVAAAELFRRYPAGQIAVDSEDVRKVPSADTEFLLVVRRGER